MMPMQEFCCEGCYIKVAMRQVYRGACGCICHVAIVAAMPADESQTISGQSSWFFTGMLTNRILSIVSVANSKEWKVDICTIGQRKAAKQKWRLLAPMFPP